ncbi:MAG TPA: helix-turn-helix transcriptional regulator [Thermohalobaculum sp.]|nr:helix-turn-helix transcriptional regulator [Thermohalobaculum sp.]
MEDYSEAAATFGDRLTLAREAQDMNQEDLARRLGIRLQTLRNWEDDRSEPRANRLQMLAGVLGVSMIWLLTGEGEGGPAVGAGEARSISVELSSLLNEIRELRVANSKANNRLARLERRLREMAAGA